MTKNILKGKRTHDDFYLNEKTKVKEYYKFILSKASKNLNNTDVLDIGCATGDFLRYIKNIYPKSNLYGAEINKNLYKVLSRKKFIKKAYNIDFLGKKKIGKYDYIFMLGVHSIFDDLYLVLKKLKTLRKNKSSKIFIFGIWNPFDVDVFVRLRTKNSNTLEKGWNVFSLSLLRQYLKKLKLKCSIFRFNLKIKILKNKADPLRSWTLSYKKNKNIVINGSNIIHHFYLIEIS